MQDPHAQLLNESVSRAISVRVELQRNIVKSSSCRGQILPVADCSGSSQKLWRAVCLGHGMNGVRCLRI
jgi:hypothetical protein